MPSRKLDTRWPFNAKMGMIKDRNGMNLTEAEDIKMRWQEYTEEYMDNHDGVVAHLQPDILECEVKWALESITTNKASRGDGIPAELFQILKDGAVKVLNSICQQIWKTQKWPQDWKRSIFIPMPKNIQTITQMHSSHTLAKQCSKIIKWGFNSIWTWKYIKKAVTEGYIAYDSIYMKFPK